VAEEGRKHYPKNAELLFFSGIYLCELGKHNEAAELFETIINTTSWPSEFGSFDVGILSYKSKHQLARVYRACGRLDGAETLLKEVRHEKPDYLPAMPDLAATLMMRNSFESAREVTQELKEKGLLLDAYVLEGKMLFMQNQYAEAVSVYERALQHEPRCVDALDGLAAVHAKVGAVKAHEDVLRRKTSIVPLSVDACIALSRFLYENGSTSEGLKEVERGLAGAPNDRTLLDHKAAILRSQTAGQSASGPRRKKSRRGSSTQQN